MSKASVPLTARPRIFRANLACDLQQELSYEGRPKTLEEHFELSLKQAHWLNKQIAGKPIMIEHHEDVIVGRVIRGSIDANNNWWVEFELDTHKQDAAAAAAAMVDLDWTPCVSLSHFRDTLEPIEVTLCNKGARRNAVITFGKIPIPDSNLDNHNRTISHFKATRAAVRGSAASSNAQHYIGSNIVIASQHQAQLIIAETTIVTASSSSPTLEMAAVSSTPSLDAIAQKMTKDMQSAAHNLLVENGINASNQRIGEEGKSYEKPMAPSQTQPNQTNQPLTQLTAPPSVATTSSPPPPSSSSPPQPLQQTAGNPIPASNNSEGSPQQQATTGVQNVNAEDRWGLITRFVDSNHDSTDQNAQQTAHAMMAIAKETMSNAVLLKQREEELKLKEQRVEELQAKNRELEKVAIQSYAHTAIANNARNGQIDPQRAAGIQTQAQNGALEHAMNYSARHYGVPPTTAIGASHSTGMGPSPIPPAKRPLPPNLMEFHNMLDAHRAMYGSFPRASNPSLSAPTMSAPNTTTTNASASSSMAAHPYYYPYTIPGYPPYPPYSTSPHPPQGYHQPHHQQQQPQDFAHHMVNYPPWAHPHTTTAMGTPTLPAVAATTSIQSFPQPTGSNYGATPIPPVPPSLSPSPLLPPLPQSSGSTAGMQATPAPIVEGSAASMLLTVGALARAKGKAKVNASTGALTAIEEDDGVTYPTANNEQGEQGMTLGPGEGMSAIHEGVWNGRLITMASAGYGESKKLPQTDVCVALGGFNGSSYKAGVASVTKGNRAINDFGQEAFSSPWNVKITNTNLPEAQALSGWDARVNASMSASGSGVRGTPDVASSATFQFGHVDLPPRSRFPQKGRYRTHPQALKVLLNGPSQVSLDAKPYLPEKVVKGEVGGALTWTGSDAVTYWGDRYDYS